MKSIDKFVLVLVASLALLLAGCGGGSSTPPESEGPTAEEMAAEMRAMEQKEALEEAHEALETALAATLNTQAALTAARTAHMGLTDAITAAVDVDAADKAKYENAASTAMGTIAAAQKIFDAAETQRMAEAEEQRKMEEAAKAAEMAKVGKALKAALGATPLSNLRADSTTTPALHSLTSSGLSVGIPNADSTASTASPRMKAGASAGSLGGWAGKHYSHTNAGTKVTNSAVVYTNQGTPSVKPFATGASFGANQAAFDSAYTASTRTLALGNPDATTDIKGDDFPTAGETTFTADSVTGAVVIRGTYQGAPGNYRCTGAACSANAETGGIDLEGTWVFVHDSGAMTSKPDANYLYFGWWLQKDKDGEPTVASAFTGVVGDVDGDQTLADPLGLTGSATYNGHAAGKFAISDPLNGGDGGHFTADATLTAKFGVAATESANNSNGLSGTLDNFMANGESVPWSVSLLRTNLDTTGGTVAFDDPDTSSVDESMDMTVWSIDGNSATADGTWNGQLYDEKPGAAPTGDGSNVATSLIGTFQSHFGSTHTMVGAFGAEKE